MLKILVTILSIYIANLAISQATLFVDNLETGLGLWTTTDDVTPNFWIANTCAGNGSTEFGSMAMYISQGGTIPGCGATGTEQYAYTNSPSGSNMATIFSTVDASCATGIQLYFDYRIEGSAGFDFCEVVYSTDNGSTWSTVGNVLVSAATWSTASIGLPAALDGTSFELGFRYTYDDTGVNGVPIAIDNVLVQGIDTVNPSISCPSDQQLSMDSGCQAIVPDYTKTMLALSDNCTDSVNILVVQNILPGTILTSPGSIQNIILTASDESGNSSQCSFALTIIDDIDPTISCPSNTTTDVNQDCEGIINDFTVLANYADNCTAIGNLVLSQSPLPGTIINGANVTTNVTIMVTDESGNTNTCSLEVTTVDVSPATIICPSDTMIYANNSCQASLGDYKSFALVQDNCEPSSSLTVIQSPSTGSTISANQVVTLTVNGGIPNIPDQCTFNVSFIDTIKPGIVCPSPVNLYVDANCEASLADYTGMGIVVENCGGYTVSQNPPAGTTLSVGPATTVVLTVSDNSSNSKQCQFIQPILDTISPTISCPLDQQISLDVNCLASIGDYRSLGSAVDNCTSSLVINQNPSSGQISSPTLITLSVTDGASNSRSCTFNLIPIDDTNPVITCPSPTSVNVTSGCDYTLSDFYSFAIASDNCTDAGSLIYSQIPIPSTVVTTGMYPITLTVEDSYGNNESCVFNLIVNDPIVPTINCPSNQNVFSDANCEVTLVDYTGMATVNDNCTTIGNLTLSQMPTNGTDISSNTTVILTVEDESGNSATCQFSAILIDTIKPSVICPSNQTISINSSCQYIVPDIRGSVSGIDNCSVFGNLSISQSPLPGSTGTGITNVLITMTDEQGNQATCISKIYPNDVDAPIISCPSPAAVNNGTTCDYNLLNYAAFASVIDNCSNYTIVQNPPIGTIVQTGMTEITLTVTDAGGNTDQCSFNLTVFETESPTINCPIDISTCNPVVTYDEPTFNDNCISFINQTDFTGLSSGDTFPIGTTIIEYTVSDSSGNSQVCQFNIEILDYPSPANILEDSILLCGINSTILSADAITSGNGVWQQLSGSGLINNQFVNMTGVNGLSTGVSVFEWSVSTTSCGTLSDTVIVIYSQQPVAAQTQDTVYSCNDLFVGLISNPATFDASGVWSTNLNAVIADINSPNTTAAIYNNGWNEFVWTISSPACPSTRDTLLVFVTRNPVINLADTTVCIDEDPVLTASGTTPQDGQLVNWYVSSGSVDIENNTSSSTSAFNFGLDNNFLVYELAHDVCPTTSDTVVITANVCNGFNPVFPTVITPNLDGKNDYFEIDYLNLLYPSCRVIIFNRWGSIVYQSTGYAEAWNGMYENEILPMGTYFYKIELNDESGTVYQGDINIIH